MNINRGFSRFIISPQPGLQSYVETSKEIYDGLPCFAVMHPLAAYYDLLILNIDTDLGGYCYCSVHPCLGDARKENEHCWGVKS